MTDTAVIIDGRAVAAATRAEIATEVATFRTEAGRAPALATFLIGDDQASAVYVGMKTKACKEVGITSLQRRFPAEVAQDELLAAVRADADDDGVDAILVQLPLPSGLDEAKILAAIPPVKDPDGLHPANLGATVAGTAGIASCTPAGVMRLLDSYDIPVAGREAVVIGRSNMVGKPMAALLLNASATVTVCHSRTADLSAHTRRADILVAAVGVPGIVTADMVKPGAAVIDIGTTRTEDGLAGDVDFDAVREVAGFITPVPGGVGPMTVATLVGNTLACARLRRATLG